MKTKMKTITVTVTEDHIRRGVPQEPEFCPVALALETIFPASTHISVDEEAVDLTHEDLRFQSVELPRSATRFIRAFDSGKPVEPFSFRVEL